MDSTETIRVTVIRSREGIKRQVAANKVHVRNFNDWALVAILNDTLPSGDKIISVPIRSKDTGTQDKSFNVSVKVSKPGVADELNSLFGKK